MIKKHLRKLATLSKAAKSLVAASGLALLSGCATTPHIPAGFVRLAYLDKDTGKFAAHNAPVGSVEFPLVPGQQEYLFVKEREVTGEGYKPLRDWEKAVDEKIYRKKLLEAQQRQAAAAGWQGAAAAYFMIKDIGQTLNSR